MLCSGIFVQGQFSLYFWTNAVHTGKAWCNDCRHLCHQFHANVQWTLWCDPIPPPAAPQSMFHSPWDEKRTKTDKLTVVCNLLVKAKWKRSTPAFNLTAEPCSSIYSYAFQKPHESGAHPPALLGGRLLVSNQVFISPLISAPLRHTSLGLIQCELRRQITKGIATKSTVPSHPEYMK